jgi:hypothetical protein
LVARDDDFPLRADHSEDVPLSRDDVRFPDFVDLHESVDHFLFVPGSDLEENESLLIGYQREDADSDCF